MNYFMGIPEDIIKNGYATLYKDDDYRVEENYEAYNKYASECREQRKQAVHISETYCIANFVLAAIIIALNANYAFRRGALAIVMLAAWLVVYFMFVLFGRRLIIGTAASALLIVLDLMFIALVALNVLLTLMYEKLDRPLRQHPTYPRFSNIDVHYSADNRPRQYDEYGR